MSKVKLSEIANIIMGQSPSGETCNGIGDGIALLNGPAEFTSYYPVPKQYTIDGKKFSDKGDILFCVRGSTTGRMNWADQKYALGRGLASISHKNGKEYNHFLKFLLQSNLNSLLNAANGSTFPNLTSDILASFELSIPEEKTQKTISFFLQSIDSKIELNNRINAELEAMAKTLYDYWFVQFDFPDKNGKPYKTSGGKMVWNEEMKRDIPEGWEVKYLTEEMDLQYGFPFSTELFNDIGNGIPVIRIRDILNCSISNYSTEEVDDKYRINKGDIIVGMDGNFHINYWNRDNCYLNQRSLRIRSNNESISEIQARYSIEPFIQAREKNVSKTTVAHLSAKDVNDLKILKADNEFQIKANTFFNSNLEKIVSNRIQNQKLTELRDWLLPMLMNGQVRVSEL
jgi:type I restriction enzyme S subunit